MGVYRKRSTTSVPAALSSSYLIGSPPIGTSITTLTSCGGFRPTGIASMRMALSGALRVHQLRELLHHPLVHRPLERHDELRDLLQSLPAPGHEFRLVAASGMRDVDLGLLASEAQREPLLGLAAVFALPRLAHEVARDVVAQPLRDLAELL